MNKSKQLDSTTKQLYKNKQKLESTQSKLSWKERVKQEYLNDYVADKEEKQFLEDIGFGDMWFDWWIKIIEQELRNQKSELLEEVRSLPKYPTTKMATYENGYNEGHNNTIIDIIQMLERQKLSILEGKK